MYEEQDPALLRAVRAAGKAVAKQQHAMRAGQRAEGIPDSSVGGGGGGRGASGDAGAGRVGALPQPSAHLPGTEVPEAVAELARQLVARVCAAHMQRAAAAAAVAMAGQEGRVEADRPATEQLQAGGKGTQLPPQQQQQQGLKWSSALSTLYEVGGQKAPDGHQAQACCVCAFCHAEGVCICIGGGVTFPPITCHGTPLVMHASLSVHCGCVPGTHARRPCVPGSVLCAVPCMPGCALSLCAR